MLGIFLWIRNDDIPAGLRLQLLDARGGERFCDKDIHDESSGYEVQPSAVRGRGLEIRRRSSSSRAIPWSTNVVAESA